MLDCATQDVASNAVAQDLGKDVIFSTANGRVPWSKGKVCLLKVHVFHVSMFVLQWIITCNILKWDLMGFLTSYLFFGVLQKSHEVSWSLIESHWVSWFNDCQSWGVGTILEHLRVWSTPCVSAPRWVGSSSLGHTQHAQHGSQYVAVVWSCAVPMCRLRCLRCAFEWNGRRMNIAKALPKRWRRGPVEVATVYGPVWNLGSQ